MIKKPGYLIITICALFLLTSVAGCASLKKKFTPKHKKKELQTAVQLREYDIKPSIELYEKHYVYWVNWYRKLITELGKNFKSDIRSSQEMISHLYDMQALLTDEKATELGGRISDIISAKVIIDKHNLTKVNETRVRRILEREYRAIKREFSPKKMKDHIRSEFAPIAPEEDL